MVRALGIFVVDNASPMSASGQKQTSRPEISMSALPPKAEIAGRQLNVRFVPNSDMLAISILR
jgi:hypothetical protein